VIIANTLLMAVFERIREMGIFAALGMKNRQVLLLFELEASILAFIGISIGIMLGSAVVLYLAAVGIPVGDIGASAGDLALGTTLYTKFVPGNILYLSAWTFLIILLVSLYPASFAARLEPVKALHAV
jgi:ABC-type antimicrobial peptide transport system permease subunit